MGSRAAAWIVAASTATAGIVAVGGAANAQDTGALPDLAAPLEVVVGPAAKALDPIAVPDPVCEATGEVCATVADVLRRDLEISGFFKVLPTSSFIASKDEPISEPKWPDWFNVGAKYLVRARVTGSGAIDLDFRVHNVHDKVTIAVDPQQFRDVERGDVRAKVHAFVNALIGVLTGEPGVFGTRIAYSAKTGAWTRGIFVMDMDGHGARAVVDDGRINAFPSFAGADLIYTTQGDGEDPRIVVGGKRIESDARFRKAVRSRTGALAVSVDTGDGSDIWRMDDEGNLTQNLTQGQGDNVSPSWSPDGTSIAFVSNRAGSPQIYVMAADGSGQRRLTMAGSYNATPDFGPGNRIAFAGLDSGTSDIFTVDLDGRIQRLTQNQGWNKDPTWSPDGRWLAFVSSREGGGIWLMSADGRWQFPLSRKPCACATPAWER